MRVVFAGTPEVALPALAAVADSSRDLVGVLTRPDAPTGRGRRLTPSPVAEAGAALGVPVLKPRHPREPEFQDALRELAPEACPVTAYGALLPQSALDIPPRGWVNLHFSVLPAWRGAAPVQHAILHGDDLTGATVFTLEEGLDTGLVLSVMTEPIRPRDTSGELLDRLATAGAGLLVATLDALGRGELTAQAQPAEGVSLAPKVTVADALVDWRTPAFHIDRQVRACTPAPGAWTTWAGDRLGLGPVEPAGPADLAPAEVGVGRRYVLVGTGD